MSRRPGNGADESDEDEGFKVTNSGRKKGSFPQFLPTLARRRSVVDALYNSHIEVRRRRDSVAAQTRSAFSKRRDASRGENGDDSNAASVARKRVIRELAKEMEARLPPTELPPLPKALEQRRRNEDRMREQMKLRVDNSSPELSHKTLMLRLADAQAMAERKLAMPRSKFWSKDQASAAVAPVDLRRPQCESCPPTLGLSDDRAISVEYRYASRPWEDPKIAQMAAVIDSDAVKAERAKRQAMERDADAVRAADLRAAKAAFQAPPNDACVESGRPTVYDSIFAEKRRAAAVAGRKP